MDLLEYYYQNLPQIDGFIPRKVILNDAKNINLYGARGVGKSALALEYASNFDKKELLYLDCKEPALRFINPASIEQFIAKNRIQLLILDHYNIDFPLPKARQHIIITNEPLENFHGKQTELLPLDFEEFLVFENSAHSSMLFSRFIKTGSLPRFAKGHKSNHNDIGEFLKSHFSSEEIALLSILSLYTTKAVSTNQIYKRAKEYFKISKDWLYKTVQQFYGEGIIQFVEEYTPSLSKKLILYDNAITKYLNPSLTFLTLFEQTTLQELLKKDAEVCSFYNLGYLDTDGVLILLSAFESEEAIWAKCQKNISKIKQAHIQDAKIITVANSYEFGIDSINFEAMPFYEWSLADDE